MKSIMMYLSVMSALVALAASHAEASQLPGCRVHIVTKLDDANIGNMLDRSGAFVDGGLVRFDDSENPRYLLEMYKQGGDGKVMGLRPSIFAGDFILMQVTRPSQNQFKMTELRNVLVGYRIAPTCEQIKIQGIKTEGCALKEIPGIKSKLESICHL